MSRILSEVERHLSCSSGSLPAQLDELPVASKGMATLDLDRERNLSKFGPSGLTEWIYGSAELPKLLKSSADRLAGLKAVGPLGGASSTKYDLSRD